MARRSSAAGDRDADESDERADEPRAHARRPHLIVIADVAAIAGDRVGIAELDGGTPVPQSTLQRWLCDSSIGRVVMAGSSVPVDLGRTTYTPSAAQRRALIARDRGCIVPGCKRKARWCDAHHVVPFPQGPTNVANMVLMCKRHHKQVHAGIITLLPNDMGTGWVAARPDGTLLRQRPPPHAAA
jgi:hypothetical protein